MDNLPVTDENRAWGDAPTDVTATDIISNNIINRILRSSFYDKAKYKNILSEKGETELQKIAYKSTLDVNNICPILQTEFKENMEIIKLPCEHCFIPEAIEKWVKEEKAVCPVCRYALDSKEVEDKSISPTRTTGDILQSIRRASRSINRPLNSELSPISIPNESTEMEVDATTTATDATDVINISRITNNFINDIMNELINEQEEEQLQRALFNSLN